MDAAEQPTFFPTDDYGVCDVLEHESIVTSFYRVFIPIWPEYSAYVIRAQDGSEQRIKIPLNKRSVLLGYSRMPAWLFAFAFAFPALVYPDYYAWSGLVAAGFLALAIVLQFVAGKLDAYEALRRGLLRRVVGFGAPPELLTEAFRAEVRTNLELMWHARSDKPWPAAIAAGEHSELLVALAEYHQEPDLVARANENATNKVWN